MSETLSYNWISYRRQNNLKIGLQKDTQNQHPSDDESDLEADKEFYQKQNDTYRPQSIPTGMDGNIIKRRRLLIYMYGYISCIKLCFL